MLSQAAWHWQVESETENKGNHHQSLIRFSTPGRTLVYTEVWVLAKHVGAVIYTN